MILVPLFDCSCTSLPQPLQELQIGGTSPNLLRNREMIVEYVLFKSPPGKTRDEILADAKQTVPKWRANRELMRKH